MGLSVWLLGVCQETDLEVTRGPDPRTLVVSCTRAGLHTPASAAARQPSSLHA